MLRKIFGPICVAGYWRSRTNEEVRQLYGGLDIVTEIKGGERSRTVSRVCTRLTGAY